MSIPDPNNTTCVQMVDEPMAVRKSWKKFPPGMGLSPAAAWMAWSKNTVLKIMRVIGLGPVELDTVLSIVSAFLKAAYSVMTGLTVLTPAVQQVNDTEPT